MNKNAIKNIAAWLTYGDLSTLKARVVEDLKLSNMPISLFGNDCMTSRLVFSDLTLEKFAGKIYDKQFSGQNTEVAKSKFDARMAQAKNLLKNVSKPHDIYQLINELNTNDYSAIFNGDEERTQGFIEMLSNCTGAMADSDSILTPILASIVLSKAACPITQNGNTSNAESNENEANELEKCLEPLVLSLIENKKFVKHSEKFNLNELRNQVLNLIEAYNQNMTLEAAQEDSQAEGNQLSDVWKIAVDNARKYFHDIGIANSIYSINKQSLWPVGLVSGKRPMFYFDKKGVARHLFSKDETRQINSDSICDLVIKGNHHGMYSALRKLQGPDAQDSSYADPLKLISNYAQMFYLMDGLGMEDEKLERYVFAFANPLIDIISCQNNTKAVNLALETALKNAQDILSREKGISYTPDVEVIGQLMLGSSDTQPAAQKPSNENTDPTPAAQNPTEGQGENSDKAPKIPAIIKKTSSEVKLISINIVKSILGKIIKNYQTSATNETRKRLSATAASYQTRREGKKKIADGQQDEARLAADKRDLVELLLADYSKSNVTTYIKYKLNLANPKRTPILRNGKNMSSADEIEQIIEILAEIESPEFQGTKGQWKKRQDEIFGELEEGVTGVVDGLLKKDEQKKAEQTAAQTNDKSETEGE